MAKKPAAEPVAERTTAFVPPATLKSLLKSARSTKESLNDISSAYGEEVRAAVDKKNLHKKAFGHIRQLDAMTPEKLADYMEHFDYMFEKSGLEERAASAQRLPGVGGVQGDETKDEGDDGGGKKKSGARDEAGAPVH